MNVPDLLLTHIREGNAVPVLPDIRDRNGGRAKQMKIRAAFDAGVKEVILPAEYRKEAQLLPPSFLSSLTLTPVQSVGEVLGKALAKHTKSTDGRTEGDTK